MELVWWYQDPDEQRAALARFHTDGPELARLIGEFGALLLTGYLTAVPDEHTDCESAYVLHRLVAVTSRCLHGRCRTGGAQAARETAGFLIACMQEADQVHQFLTDIRGNAAM